MSSRKFLKQLLGLTLTMYLVTGCGGAPAEPTAAPAEPTAAPAAPSASRTSVPPTATPTPVLPTPTPIPAKGVITGMILDKDGKPLANIIDQQTLIVALVCLRNGSDIECLHEGSPWEANMTSLFETICETDNPSSECLLHLGQGAASVGADGSYAIADVPPGKYGLILLHKYPGVVRAYYHRSGIELVQAGETIKHDFSVQ